MLNLQNYLLANKKEIMISEKTDKIKEELYRPPHVNYQKIFEK